MTTQEPGDAASSLISQALDCQSGRRRRRTVAAVRSTLAVLAFAVTLANTLTGAWPGWLDGVACGYLLCWLLALPETGRRRR